MTQSVGDPEGKRACIYYLSSKISVVVAAGSPPFRFKLNDHRHVVRHVVGDSPMAEDVKDGRFG
jgi:hypothetical protein